MAESATEKRNSIKRNRGLSLHGLKFEDAIRAFMKTPKPPQNQPLSSTGHKPKIKKRPIP
jgi:hypothetical protein